MNSYASCSNSFSSFKECFKKDSVLSFKSAKGFFPSIYQNMVYQAKFPSRMKEKQWIFFTTAAMSTLILIQLDTDIDKKFKPIKESNPFIENVSPQITEIGDYYGYMLLAGFGGYSILFHNYRAFRVSLLAAQAAVTAGLWIRAGKYLSGRMRPGQSYGDAEYPNGHWFGPFGQFNAKNSLNRGVGAFDAFPSGHTGAAFSIATVFADQYHDYKAVPYVAYSLAGIVGISRLIEHEHWFSDVMVGGAIGYFCGRQVSASERKMFPDKSISKNKSHSYFYPFSMGNVNGIGWKMVF